MPLENNNNNKRGKKGIYAFLDRQGFYIILLLCVCIVGVTGFWVTRQEPDSHYFSEENWRNEENNYNRPDITLVEENSAKEEEEDDQVVMGNETKESSEKQKEENKNESIKPEENKNDIKEETVVAPVEETVVETSNKAVIYNMILPVQGSIGMPYAEDHLVYHKTLNQWKTHRGIDIHAKEGTPVRAALDGEVIEVITDKLLGIIITLQHDEYLLTRYSNLATGAMVSVGDFVEKGQVISAVGKTSLAKSEEGPLLHFQVINDTKLVNPQLFLPKIN